MTTTEHEGCGCEHNPEAGGMGRRSFLKHLAGTGSVAGLATQGLSTKLAFAQAGYAGDVLVVLSLRGGFDGVNAIVPGGDAQYHALRPNIGIPHSSLIPLTRTFGMHPALKPLKPLWDKGSFGVVHAVGMQDPSRSHFQAMAEMERAAPGTALRSGWLDRTLGLRARGTSYQGVQLGDTMAAASFNGPTPELAMTSVDSFTMSGVHDGADRRRWRRALLDMNADAPRSMAAPARTALSAMGTAAELQRAGYTPRKGSSYPHTELGLALRDVARLIKARVGLQVASVDYGDWDMHADMGTVGSGWMHDHLSELARALAAFAHDLGPTMSRVTLLTLSEFGRRLKENGSGGTDHGHGQAVLLLGGGVKGGQVLGQWPGLAPSQLVDGDLAGTTDYRSVLAEALEKRCGAGSLTQVFPGLPTERVGAFKVKV
ncbi:MAG: DUF1501 domain-containing protein [Actinomycetes bacterium]